MSQPEIYYKQRRSWPLEMSKVTPASCLLPPPRWLLPARLLKHVSCLNLIQMHKKRTRFRFLTLANYSLNLGKSLNLFEFNNSEPQELLNGSNEGKVVGMLCKLYTVIKHELLSLQYFTVDFSYNVFSCSNFVLLSTTSGPPHAHL